MSQKSTTTIGIEYDILGIRAAKVSQVKGQSGTGYTLLKVEELSGSFSKDEDLLAGLKKIHDKIGISSDDQVVSCVAGKQVYVAQIPFRRLPAEEMASALRFEIKKNLPFEIAGSTIDYQIISGGEKKEELAQVIVTAVANLLLNRQLRVLDKAGIKPYTVDVLPLAIGNVINARTGKEPSTLAQSALHIGPDVSTLVINGESATFYHRNIYFTAAELFGPGADESMASRERDRRIESLAEEIGRSFAYYENAYHVSTDPRVVLMGPYAETREISDIIEQKLRLAVERSDLAAALNPKFAGKPGRFDVAVALAMRDR